MNIYLARYYKLLGLHINPSVKKFGNFKLRFAYEKKTQVKSNCLYDSYFAI